MKRIIALVLVAVLSLSTLSGCNKEKESSTTKKAYNTEILTEKLNTLEDEWVIDGGDEDYCLPSFNINSKEAQRLNDEIAKKCKEIAEKGKASGYISTRSKLSVYKNIAFIVIEKTPKIGDKQYEVFSISLLHGNIPTQNEILGCFKVNRIVAFGAMYDALKAQFEYYFRSFSDSNGGAYESNMEKTLSDDNIKSSKLYISGTGELRFLAKMYSIDGKTEIDADLLALNPPKKVTSNVD